MRTRTIAHVAAAILALCLCAVSPAHAEPMEGVDYVLIDPPAVRPGSRIEVVEFFHYGCAACYRLEPLLNRWAPGLPDDVEFLRAPALRNTSWIPLTRLFFALDSLGALPQLHGQVYREIHENGLNLGDSSRSAKWAASNGLDRKAFLDALDDEETTARVQRARDLTVAYGVRNTPSIVVDGRYLTGAAMVGSAEALLPVVDGLIEMARRSRGKP